jgi:hypothetical protein
MAHLDHEPAILAGSSFGVRAAIARSDSMHRDSQPRRRRSDDIMMGLASRLAKILGPGDRGRTRFRRRGGPNRAKPRFGCEALETRAMLSGLGTDYTVMGGQWDDSRTISFSFAPDGVSWDQGTNVAGANLDAEFGGTSWQGLVARALQTWAAASNLNFTQVSDGPYDFNASGIGQGDPKFGDIRIGGYRFGETSTIARTYGPPPNGQTGAGEVELNTSYNFAPGSNHDFQTVILHEVGHSLGLGESPRPSSVMYTYYQGARQALTPYDVEGIQSLYGPRVADSYQSQGEATSAATALDLTSSLNSGLQALLSGASLATIGDVEYFSVVAPALKGASLSVSAQALGHSLLSPKVSVIDPSTGATLAVDANPAQYGDNVSVSIPGVQAGHRYLIAVTGATNDVFSVGSYALQLGFSGGTAVNPTPTPAPAPQPLPPAPTPAPVPAPPPGAPAIQPDIFAYNNSFASATELGPITLATLGSLTLPSGSNYQVFTFEVARPGVVLVAAVNANVVVGDAFARPVASGTGLIGFVAPQAGARYFLIFSSTNGAPVPNYGLAVQLIPSPPTPVAASSTSPTPTSPTNHHSKSLVKVKVSTTPTPKGHARKSSRPNQ